jgi:hypothetical protein
LQTAGLGKQFVSRGSPGFRFLLSEVEERPF